MCGEWEKFDTNALNVYLGNVWFEYWLDCRLSTLRGFKIFLDYSSKYQDSTLTRPKIYSHTAKKNSYLYSASGLEVFEELRWTEHVAEYVYCKLIALVNMRVITSFIALFIYLFFGALS